MVMGTSSRLIAYFKVYVLVYGASNKG